MNKKANFFNFSINKILSDDLSVLDNARLRLLYYGLALSFFTLLIILTNVVVKYQVILSITTGVMFVSSIVLFKYLTYRPRWTPIAHMVLIIATLVNFADIFVAIHNISIVTVEAVIMIMLFGFYMLGKKYGTLYTLLNVVPVSILLILKHTNGYLIPFKPESVDQSTNLIAMVASFVLIVFMHSYFYTAFIRTIKELEIGNKKQRGLAAEFELAVEKAERSSEAKSEFLSTMSHEIRTPLNAVIGMSNLLISGNPRPDQKENLEVLKFSAGNLLSIINDVLDFNKIESGKLVFEHIKFNLPELMQNICGGQVMSAKVKGILFKLDVDSTLSKKVLVGDPTRISQIVFNLVNNAIKFTADGTVTVKATCVEDRSDKVIVNFCVKDTGIGIEQSRLDVIFEPFIQESLSTTRRYGGTGLGLAIVNRLLELQGIKIKVSSVPGTGSEFSFNMEFPVSAEVVETPVASRLLDIDEFTESLSSIRMLIAEDNPVNVLLMQKLLSKWDLVPAIAENGECAVELVRENDFDIILMDLQMPIMNGFDAAKAIRKMDDPHKSNTPIIALTASALFDIRERVEESGMNDYVSKPFKPNELFEKIQQLVVHS
ncbi:response regulator [Mucilaginibacter corticis]|uniref:histidine kinase n=1 Tax=Mucilaginibacter corticis TaxID=2597670 RepID=A0A556MFA7_9SPHI|nr:response regulator [Mucilaginibacter corticis]TSJ38624.1 response regulator [Mucilaginibacter corticis]